ncbi:exonuclease domain-containing protein [Lactobacillus sp. ESL0791]|uniref:3'-5' exonuclease n=1 Tax=Lactobacillus sp. ESL0791 TaxID=2983234 RepID=UPI0023F66A67|nr:exonuclease domain-containing protein [Lactobacillus sp. ESL0791]MDF7638405.1 exonuclease domain-containing protein [Lactobacillus sp. ESL0791]
MSDFVMGLGMLTVFASIALFIVDLVKLVKKLPARISYSLMLFVAGWFIAFFGAATSIGMFLVILAIGVIIEWTIYAISKALRKPSKYATDNDKANLKITKDLKPNLIVKDSEAEKTKITDNKKSAISENVQEKISTLKSSTDKIISDAVLKDCVLNPKTPKIPKYQQFLSKHGVDIEDVSDTKLKDCVVFDLETTELGYENDEIIHVAAVKVKDDQVIDQFNSYVKPKKSIPSYITKITGITDADVANADPITEVMPKFNEFVDDATLVGHNIIQFDIPFVVNNGFAQKHIKAIDTLRMVRRIRDDFPVALKDMKFATLKEYFGLGNKPHTSLEDCKTNLVIYQKLRDHDLEYKVPICQEPDSELKGLTFVLTGIFDKPNKDIKAEIEAHGGCVTGSVSTKTDYLIDGVQPAKILKNGKYSANEWRARELQMDKGKIQIIAYPYLEQLISDRKAD